MWVWAELQIEPTQDALAIKRAYAKRLKVTRPDDDAAAYQRLREAFDQAMAWARRAADVPPVPAARVAPEPHETAAPADAPAAALPEDDAPPLARADDGFEHTRRRGDTKRELTAEAASAPNDHDAGDTATMAPADDGFDGDAEIDVEVRPGTAAEPSPRTDDGKPDWPAPEGIARGVHAYWQQHGDDALVALWPRVQHDLDRIPFAWRGDASAWMASLVLDHPALPAGFVEPLADHFQWGLDFRVTHALGSERAFALAQRLRELGILRVNDPAVLRRYAEVLRLQALRESGRRMRASVLSLLLPEHVLERWWRMPDRLRSGLGIDEAARADIAQWLQGAAAVRTLVFMAMLAGLFGTVTRAHGGREMLFASLAAFAVLACWVVALVQQRWIDRLQRAVASRIAFLAGEPGNRRFGLAMALIVPAMVLPALQTGNALVTAPLSWLLSALALLAGWSTVHPSSALLVPVTAALTAALRALFPPDAPLPTLAAMSLAWTLAAHWLLVRRPAQVLTFYRSPLTYFRPTQAWGWILWIVFFKGVLAFAAAITVLSLPLTLIVQSIGYGQRFAFASIGLGFAIAHALSGGRGLVEVFPLLGLLLAAVAMAVLQAIANLVARAKALR